MEIYIDVCTFCRPFDNQDNLRVSLETNAYYIILKNIELKKLKLISSPMIEEELNSITEIKEKLSVEYLIQIYSVQPRYDLKLARIRTEDFIKLKLGIADAAHLAFAEQFSDYLISCDDKFIKKSKRTNSKTKVINPIEFCIIENLI
jgi:hypothetical protein